MGLSFENIPAGFTSRYVLLIDEKSGLPVDQALVFHTANNYAPNPLTAFGKIPVGEQFNVADAKSNWKKPNIVRRTRHKFAARMRRVFEG